MASISATPLAPHSREGCSNAPAPADEPLPLVRLLTEAVYGKQRATLWCAAACLGLLVFLFGNPLTHMIWTWSIDENYGHGFLVPLISLYFANESLRRAGAPASRGGLCLGLGLLLFSVFGRLATTLVPIGMVGDVSFVLGLAGIIALVFGSRALKQFGFPLFFLLFMIPLPIALYAAMATPLQRFVCRVGSALLTSAGIPVLSQGNMMTLPGGVQLFVAEACSGMRQLTGFLALTTAVAWIIRKPGWYRLILIASSIPIAIFANVLRVTLTAWLAYAVDPALARGQFHTMEGLLMMGVGLAMLWAECVVLNMFESGPSLSKRPGMAGLAIDSRMANLCGVPKPVLPAQAGIQNSKATVPVFPAARE